VPAKSGRLEWVPLLRWALAHCSRCANGSDCVVVWASRPKLRHWPPVYSGKPGHFGGIATGGNAPWLAVLAGQTARQTAAAAARQYETGELGYPLAPVAHSTCQTGPAISPAKHASSRLRRQSRPASKLSYLARSPNLTALFYRHAMQPRQVVHVCRLPTASVVQTSCTFCRCWLRQRPRANAASAATKPSFCSCRRCNF